MDKLQFLVLIEGKSCHTLDWVQIPHEKNIYGVSIPPENTVKYRFQTWDEGDVKW